MQYLRNGCRLAKGPTSSSCNAAVSRCRKGYVKQVCPQLFKSPCPGAVTELVWQRPLTILNYPDPRLRAPNARIGVFDDRLRELAAEMFDVMYRQGRC